MKWDPITQECVEGANTKSMRRRFPRFIHLLKEEKSVFIRFITSSTCEMSRRWWWETAGSRKIILRVIKKGKINQVKTWIGKWGLGIWDTTLTFNFYSFTHTNLKPTPNCQALFPNPLSLTAQAQPQPRSKTQLIPRRLELTLKSHRIIFTL